MSGLTDEQKRLRKTGITATDAPAILGLDSFRTAIDVWREKRFDEQQEDNLALRLGRHLEPSVISVYAEDEKPASITSPGTLRHPKREVILATPDRIAEFVPTERRVVEAKTARWADLADWGPAGTDEVPQAYVVQVAVQLAVTGLERADLAVLVGGSDFRVYRLVRDSQLEALVLDAMEAFWREYVVDGKEPPIDASEAYGKHLAKKWPRPADTILCADADAERWAIKLRSASAQLAAAKVAQEEAINHLKAAIGDASGIEGSFGVVTWKATRGGGRTAWREVAMELRAAAELIAKHTRGAGGRRFRHPWSGRNAAEDE